MPKRKASKPVQAAPNSGSKQMILTVDPTQHTWIKTIAEQTGTPQPKVVNLILGEAVKTDPIEYVTKIKKIHAKTTLQKLESEARRIEAERKQLTELLKD